MEVLALVVVFLTRPVVGYGTRSGPESEKSCHARTHVLVPSAYHNADRRVRDKGGQYPFQPYSRGDLVTDAFLVAVTVLSSGPRSSTGRTEK